MYGFDELNYAVLVIGRVLDAVSPDAMRVIASVVNRWSEAHQGVIVSVPAGSALEGSATPVVVGVRVAACDEKQAVPTGPFGDEHVAARAAIAEALPEAFWREVGAAAGAAGSTVMASPLATRLVASGRWPFAALVYGARCFGNEAAGRAFVRGHAPDGASFVMQKHRMGAAGVEVARASHDTAHIVPVDVNAGAHAARFAAVAGLPGELGYHVIASYGAPHADWRPPGWVPAAPPVLADEDAIRNRAKVLVAWSERPDLHAAAAAGDVARVRELLDGGADLDEPSGEDWPFDEWSALHFAALRGRLDVVAALLERGADPNTWGGSFVPLHLAAGGGHLDVVRALLAAGANLERVSSNNFTALYFAAHQGHAEVVRALLAEGAQPTRESGWRPIHCAAQGGLFATRESAEGRRHIDEGERAVFVEIVRMLCDAGDSLGGLVDLSFGSGASMSPLGMALRWGTIALVRELLERGAPLEDTPEFPLMTLAANSVRDAREKVALLRERGCAPAPNQAPGFHSMTYAYLVAGRAMPGDDLQVKHVRALAALAQRWQDEHGLAVVAIPSGGDMRAALDDDENAYLDDMTIGLSVAHSSIADEPTPVSIERMRHAIAAARDLPPAFWADVRAVLPDEAAEAIEDAPIELRITSCGPLSLARLHFGACTDDADGPHWYLNARDYRFLMAPLGVAGLSVEGASYDGAGSEVVDVSEEAHAQRVDDVADVLRGRATYLLAAQYD